MYDSKADICVNFVLAFVTIKVSRKVVYCTPLREHRRVLNHFPLQGLEPVVGEPQ